MSCCLKPQAAASTLQVHRPPAGSARRPQRRDRVSRLSSLRWVNSLREAGRRVGAGVPEPSGRSQGRLGPLGITTGPSQGRLSCPARGWHTRARPGAHRRGGPGWPGPSSSLQFCPRWPQGGRAGPRPPPVPERAAPGALHPPGGRWRAAPRIAAFPRSKNPAPSTGLQILRSGGVESLKDLR